MNDRSHFDSLCLSRYRCESIGHLRMLIAETPVVDLDLRLAIEEHRRLELEVDRLDRILDDLRAEERGLSDRLDRAAPNPRG